MATVVNFTVTDSIEDTPVSGVHFLMLSNNVVIKTGFTDSLGVVTFSGITTGEYEVRSYKLGARFNTERFYVNVDDSLSSNNFDIVCEETPLSSAQDSRFCKVTGYFFTPDGVKKDVEYSFRLLDTIQIGRLSIVDKAYCKSVDGVFNVDLLKDSKYFVTGTGFNDEGWVVKTPDHGRVDIMDLVFPYPAKIETGNESYSVTKNTSISIPMSIILSSGTEFGFDENLDITDIIIAEPSNDNIDVVIDNDTSSLTVVGKSIGSSEIAISRKVSTGRYDPPDLKGAIIDIEVVDV